jgi:hypothetical protein
MRRRRNRLQLGLAMMVLTLFGVGSLVWIAKLQPRTPAPNPPLMSPSAGPLGRAGVLRLSIRQLEGSYSSAVRLVQMAIFWMTPGCTMRRGGNRSRRPRILRQDSLRPQPRTRLTVIWCSLEAMVVPHLRLTRSIVRWAIRGFGLASHGRKRSQQLVLVPSLVTAWPTTAFAEGFCCTGARTVLIQC